MSALPSPMPPTLPLEVLRQRVHLDHAYSSLVIANERRALTTLHARTNQQCTASSNKRQSTAPLTARQNLSSDQENIPVPMNLIKADVSGKWEECRTLNEEWLDDDSDKENGTEGSDEEWSPGSESGTESPDDLTETGDVRRFQCKECGVKLMTDGMRKKHQFTVHGMGRKFACVLCDKEFPSRSSLERHERIHRTGQQCSQCGLILPSPATLERHLAAHTGVKPFLCGECGKAFDSKNSLRSHEATHREERPYQCKVCEKSFKLPSTLLLHSRRHAGNRSHSCPACTKSFWNRNALNRHLLTHTREKPYQCTFCRRRFSQEGNMRTHMRVHTGEKPYTCEVCGEGFSHNVSRKAHMKKHG